MLDILEGVYWRDQVLVQLGRDKLRGVANVQLKGGEASGGIDGVHNIETDF